ncbi:MULTISPECIES: TolC family protein [Hyphobacterium]|uniref:TolC family protein n=1 Tax=Hyphobacterium vulgare TaxID=1736751 RepID=A0ABV6ZW14_9PROT|nr:TolC family protein [Hyphobacterium sp. SN044]MCF8880506.1 TolC family protein [Hyphobacterium sp. SN044]
MNIVKRARLCALLGAVSLSGPALSLEEPTSGFDREAAVSLALANAPGIEAAALEAEASGALIAGAGLRPNPTLEIESDTIAGTAGNYLLNAGETSVALLQPLERGGDAEARVRLAQREFGAVALAQSSLEADLVRDVELAFVALQAATARFEVAIGRREAVASFAEVVERRVQAARDPVMARSRVAARLAEAEIDVQAARREVLRQSSGLASYWAASQAPAVELESFFTRGEAPAPGRALETADLRRLRAERDIRDARLQVETARAIPDATVGLTGRHLASTDDLTVGFRFAIPLQVWNANRAEIESARIAAQATDARISAALRDWERNEELNRSRRVSAAEEVLSLETTVIPTLEEALWSARSGYERGVFSILDVFDTQRALADARSRRVDALQALHEADIHLLRLYASPRPAGPQQD